MVEQEKDRKPLRQSAESGQALLEYALILILVVVALAAALCRAHVAPLKRSELR